MPPHRLTRRDAARLGLASLSAAALMRARPSSAAGGTLVVALPNNPATLDPIQISNHDAMAITNLIWENLLEVDLDGNPVPSLARAMPRIADDQLAWTFDLRDDVVFHDGSRMTAEDVKYSYEYMLDPKNRSARRTLHGPIQEIVVDSPTRITFRLRTPFRPWPQYMTKFMGVFPKGSREAKGDDAFRSNPAGLGTGPGVFVEWRQDDLVELRRNPAYWRGKDVPAWERVQFRIVPEDASRVAYLQTGRAHIISAPPPREFERLKTVPGVRTGQKVAVGGIWFMQTNTRRAPFDDVNFRKAVACAIDRERIARDVLGGLLDPTATPAPTAASYHDKEAAAALAYDPAKARAYLAKSKYPQGAEFELLVPSIPYLFDSRDAAVVMQGMLAEVGIKMRLGQMEMPQILQRALGGTQVASLLPLMGPSDPTFVIQICYTPDQLMSKSSGYTNPALDQALAESYRTTDQAKLDPIYRRIQQILVEDSPHVWLGFVGVANAWREEVKDFKPNTGLTIWTRDVRLA